ncbi:MAG: hypothetical protein GY785_15800 [Gammaproteobacteria bacterium]|nr:hypothetical protein [Gammaproteobacteria bacterium]
MTEVNEDKLDLAAKRLATEISPERDLWPGIVEAIEAPRRSRWTPMFAQAAAVVLLIGASSAVTYVAVKGEQGPVTQVSPDLIFERASFGGRHNLGPGFQDARNSLAAEFDVELARLSPESRADVEANLELVHQAIVEINQALEQDPNNALLQAKLLGAYREELSVLRRVGGLTRDVMMRNDI